MFFAPLALACAVGTVGDGNGESADTGSLSLELALDNGAEINQVDWEITREAMEPMSGLIDTSAPGATASVEVFGLDPGDGYTITMTATATDEQTECKGSADFSVAVGQATDLMVMLRCEGPARFGAVRVNGKFNVCAELVKAIVSPLQTSVGNSIDLFADGEDAEGDELRFWWMADGGDIPDADNATAKFICTEEGDFEITVTVSDDDWTYCKDSWSVAVRCVGGGGTGGTGGDAGGSGGMPGPE